MNSSWPWAVLALLGAYHGLNPAMGWLFALALGLQERRRLAVFGALVPIALGHAVAITIAILVLRFAQQFLPIHTLRLAVALILFALGFYRLFRTSHPKGSGMRVGGKDLFLWSFLMASAHGAGLMIVPALLSQPMSTMDHGMGEAIVLSPMVIALAVLVHTASMLLVAGILAIVFFETYEQVGLRILKHTWVNFELLWAIALLISGSLVLMS